MRFSTLVSAAAFFELSIAGYVLEDDYMTDFFGNFNFFTEADPTEGFVKYVDQATARQTNLINSTSTATARFGVDSTNKTPGGRPSIRLESKKKYDNGLIVVDVAHMPFGCGTWPAFWTVGPNWPNGGEIDIIEGVNDQTNNGMTLHTSPGCQIGSDTTQFSGSVTTSNCDVNAKGQSKNVGCSIASSSKQSYGAGLNQIGGGIYATQWNSDGINIYFFPRNAIPADLLTANPNPSGWGKPAAKFAGACNIDKMFAEQQIVIDTTFCGQWAGDAWSSSSCSKKAKTCEEYVRDNPQAFADAYWDIKGLRIYQDDGKAPAAVPSVPATPPKSTGYSVAAPIPTIKSSLAAIAPPASSQAVLPVPSSKLVSGVPSKPSTAVAAPLSSSAAAAPGLPSQVIPAPAVPLPTTVAAAPGLSSNSSAAPAIPLPTSVAAAPGLPSQIISAPAVPLPTTVAAAPGLPSPGPQSSPTRGGPGSARPSRTLQSQANAPTGANGMPGWNWPVAGDAAPVNGPNATTPAASPPKASGAPAPNTTKAATVPTSEAAIAQPSNAPLAPAKPVDVAPAAPIIPAAPNPAPVKTIYETVYLTVPAPAAATPAPDAKKARMARQIRDHRRRWTQHHARR